MTQPIDPTATDPPIPAPVPATAPADDQTVALAATLQKMVDDAQAGNQRAIKGSITAIAYTASPPTVSLTMSGDTTVVDGVRYIDSYSPVVGDTVLMEKQGPDVFVLGQLNDASSGASNGWSSVPTLGAGFSAATQTPQFRLIVDNGDLKMQLRGRLNITGTPTAVCTMGTGFRPAVLRSLSAATDTAPANLSFDTSGAVTLSVTTGGGAVTGTSGSTAGAGTGSTAGTGSGAAGTGATGSSAPGTDSQDTASTVSHSHGGAVVNTTITHDDGLHSHVVNSHTHTGPSHTHTESAHVHTESAHTHAAGSFTSPSIPAPSWVSLDGLEYFL